MTEPMIAKGVSIIHGFGERLKFALKVLFTGRVEIEIEFMAMYTQFIKKMTKDQAHILRKLTQKVERNA